MLSLTTLSRRVIISVTLLFLLVCQLSDSNHSSLSPALPNLNGEAATQYLKQQGLHTSLGAAITAARYAVYEASSQDQVAYRYYANNPAQHWQARFTPEGMSLHAASSVQQSWQFGIKLHSAGYGGQQIPVAPGTLTSNGNRIEYARPLQSKIQNPKSEIQEWYINKPEGVEQGFTLEQPPAERVTGEPLRLVMEVDHNWRMRATADGQAVEFRDRQNSETLRYDKLVVQDATGRELAARMQTEGRELWLEVEDEDASYPVTIDPTFSQQAYFKASNTEQGDNFGFSVAIAGDTVVVGARTEDSNATGVDGDQGNNAATDAGAAYVFVRNGSTWTQQAYLKASNTSAGDEFGYSVAIAGDTMVVSTPYEDSNATGVDGDENNNLATDSGAAYVFVRNGTTWTQQAYLKASNTGGGDRFGHAVAVWGDTVVVGALSEDSNATGVGGDQSNNSAAESGAVYVFVRNSTTWTQQAYLKASNTGDGDFFGNSVAVSGDTVAVGAVNEDSNATGLGGDQGNNAATDSGAAYVFVRNGTTWTQQAYLKASNTEADDQFGADVDMSGNTVVVGARFEDSNATGVGGDQSNNLATDSGAAYVFVRNGTTWTQQAYLKASNTRAWNMFGWALAVADDRVVVGAVYGNTTDNNSSGSSGAAYVFVRNGTTWTPPTRLNASNAEAGDFFGYSVAVAGNTVVVGATFESSNATGVNGDETNNAASLSGAAYTFLIYPNTVPAIIPSSVTRQTGSSPINGQIATATDTEDAEDMLQIQISSDGINFGNTATRNGVTLTLTDSNAGATGINPNAMGQVFADVVAACGAGNATFTLQVTDSSGTMTTTPFTVTVNANTPPVLTYNNPAATVLGMTSSVNPATGPSDNGNITSIAVHSKGTFTGDVSVNSSGVVSISNAAPVGTHAITIRATDNCNQTTDTTFNLTIGSCTDATLVTFSNLRADARMYRYQVTPASATLDLTVGHPELIFPHHGIVIPGTGDLLVSQYNGAAGGDFLGSFLRYKDPLGAMTFDSKFTTPDMNLSFWLAIRNNELFMPQGVNNMLRFLLDANGNLTPNGIVTDGLGNTTPRGIVLTPWGELFVTRCCGDDYIVRYKFDTNGNPVLNGTISGNGLSNPHGMAFSARGELFVANFDGHSVSRFTFDANHNASANGQITHSGLNRPIDVTFSPWGELFVSNDGVASVTRFVLDSAHTATFSGSFSTPSNLHGLLFLQPSSVCTLSPPPTVTALSVTPQIGSPANNVQIGTAIDGEDAEDILQLQISSDGNTFGNTAMLNGVTITLTDKNAGAAGTNPDSAGKIFADVVAACGATNTTFTVRAIDSSGAPGAATVTVTVTTATPMLAINDVSIKEGNAGTTELVFTITLTGAQGSCAPVTVSYAAADNLARLANSDYANTAGTLTFSLPHNSNSITQSVKVPITGDGIVESNETFFVNLSGVSGATIADAQGVGTITNDDNATIAINDVDLTEGNNGLVNALFNVTLSAPVDQSVVVSFATNNGTATTANNDYQAASGLVTFLANSTAPQTISIAVNGDSVIEVDETFQVNLTPKTLPYEGVTILDNQGIGTIKNDDTNTCFDKKVVRLTDDLTVTFTEVTGCGETTAVPRTASTVGTLPAGYSLQDLNLAYDITTTATYSGPIIVTFTAPSTVTPELFARLRILHGENGQLVDRTILTPGSPAPNFATRELSARVDSLSPFVVAVAPLPQPPIVAGSVLVFPLYTSDVNNFAAVNTRLNFTNIDPTRLAYVHVFFVSNRDCTVADTILCLTPNQTASFLASDFDPGTTGYVIAVAVDAQGCPINFNHLMGSESVKLASGHTANFEAQAIAALPTGVFTCNAAAPSATLNFDGVQYSMLPQTLAVNNVASPADGNDTLLVLDRIGGDFYEGQAARLSNLAGLVYNDREIGYSFVQGTSQCQLIGRLNTGFPRTSPPLHQIIPKGRTGWLRFNQSDNSAMIGVLMNLNPNGFNQGHYLHVLRYTTAALTIPVYAPTCVQ